MLTDNHGNAKAHETIYKSIGGENIKNESQQLFINLIRTICDIREIHQKGMNLDGLDSYHWCDLGNEKINKLSKILGKAGVIDEFQENFIKLPKEPHSLCVLSGCQNMKDVLWLVLVLMIKKDA